METPWDACGDVMYRANETSNGRHSRWTDWSWNERGLPLARHDVWTEVLPGWESVETFELDGSGRVVSSVIKTHPGEFAPPVPDQRATYFYDDAGHAIRQDIDGKTMVSAAYDAAGRLTALDVYGSWPQRWTYDGCRP